MRMRWMVMLALVLCCGTANALATYDLVLEVDLFPNGNRMEFPTGWSAPPGGVRDPIDLTNRLGWAQRPGASYPSVDGGVHFGAGATATETKPTPGYPTEGPHGTAEVSGWADSDAITNFSWSEASAEVMGMTLRFVNISSLDIWIDWKLVVDWAVNVQIDNPALEYADAGYFVQVAGGGVNLLLQDFFVANTTDADVDEYILSFKIPAMTATTVGVSIYAFGYADSSFVPPPPPPPRFPDYPPDSPIVPEPMTMVLMGAALAFWGVRNATMS